MAKRPLKTPQLPPGDRLEFFRWMHRLVLEGGDKSTAAIADEVHFSAQAVYKALTGPRMPSKLMTERIAKTQGGEPAVEPALRLWTAAVAEERTTSGAVVGRTDIADPVPSDHQRPAGPGAGRPGAGSAAENSAFTERTTSGSGISPERTTRGSGSSAERGTSGPSDSAVQGTSGARQTSPDHREGEAQAEPPSSKSRTAVLDKPPAHQPGEIERPEMSAINPAGLTAREQEVLRAWLLAESKVAVAKQLHVTPSTVRTHLQRIRAKYAASDRPAATKAALVARAVEAGLLSIDEL